VYLIDFDTARPVQNKKRYLTGTGGYRSPDYFRSRVCGPDTDLWAAGVILHELVFGVGADPYEWKNEEEEAKNAIEFREDLKAMGKSRVAKKISHNVPKGAQQTLFKLFLALFAKPTGRKALDYAKRLVEWSYPKAPLPAAGARGGTWQCAKDVQGAKGAAKSHRAIFRGKVAECFRLPRPQRALQALGLQA